MTEGIRAIDWTQAHMGPLTFRRIAPELGEHTEEVLLSIGYSWDDIGKLKDADVIL